MLRVLTLCNRINGKYQDRYLALERSLMLADVPFEATVRTGPWSWRKKVQWELEMCERYPDDHLVFIDTFDVLFVGDKDTLEEIVTRQPLLFQADRGEAPWPVPAFAEAYEKRRKAISPWRWINGSGPAGRAEAIASAIRAGANFNFPESDLYTDQFWWTQVYLAGYGELDQKCELALTLYYSEEGDYTLKDGKVHNNITGTSPQFIHASGHSWCWIPEELIPPEIPLEDWKPCVSPR